MPPEPHAEPSLQDRIDGLEARSAEQDRVIEDLNAIVVAQWSRLDEVLRRLASLEDRLQDRTPQDPADEPPPPHY